MKLTHLLLATTIIICSWPSGVSQPSSPTSGAIANDDESQTDEGVPVTTPVLDNDEDLDNPANRIIINEITQQPLYGTATIDGTGIEYDPTTHNTKCAAIAGQSDEFTDTYKYNIRDLDDNLVPVSNEATVTITVNCPRAAPNAVNDVSTVTNEATPICIDVLDNDTDPEGDTNGLTIVSITQPNIGTTSQVAGCDGIQYTPQPNHCDVITGQSSYTGNFTYTIEDSDDELTDTAIVIVTVNCEIAPNAVNDTLSTIEGTAITFDPTINDSDPDNPSEALSITSNTYPTFGTITRSGNDITYTPNSNYCNKISASSYDDKFTYTVSDTLDDNMFGTATITMTIICGTGN